MTSAILSLLKNLLLKFDAWWSPRLPIPALENRNTVLPERGSLKTPDSLTACHQPRRSATSSIGWSSADPGKDLLITSCGIGYSPGNAIGVNLFRSSGVT